MTILVLSMIIVQATFDKDCTEAEFEWKGTEFCGDCIGYCSFTYDSPNFTPGDSPSDPCTNYGALNHLYIFDSHSCTES